MKGIVSKAARTVRSPRVCHRCRNSRSYSGITEKLPSLSTPEGLRAHGPFRTRFAPSPTGYLHLGSLRTALFNYLIAKATGGQFLLRIEDTDQKRTIPDAEQRLFEDLEWAGIEWDEGPKVGGLYGPYKQSERLAIYTSHAEQLIKSGHAYRCFCTQERLHKLAQLRNTEGAAAYDRACQRKYSIDQAAEMAAEGKPHVVRLKVPKKYPPLTDIVHGVATKRVRAKKYPTTTTDFVPSSFDDPILIKSDGFPTYHLANVVDDHLMKITHVIRGAEWMPSTPQHLVLYNAFGWTPPQFAHVGLLLDASRAKLSKRNQDIDVASYRKQGIFPETLTNFVALLGWSHTQKKDIMSMDDLIQNASMKYTRGDSVVSFEKLWYLQKNHAARYALLPPSSNPSHSLINLAVEPLVKLLNEAPAEDKSFFTAIPSEMGKKDYVLKVLLADAIKYTTPPDFLERNRFFFKAPVRAELEATITPLQLGTTVLRTTAISDKLESASLRPQILPSHLLPIIAQFEQIEESSWDSEEIRGWINTISLQASLKLTPPELGIKVENEAEREAIEANVQKAWGKMIHEYLRWALLAKMSGPESAATMIVLGRDEVLKRLSLAQEVMTEWEEQQEVEKEVVGERTNTA
ncbi:hypothetical protein BP6252_00563 [Coleophoma cylindrospora]|uniref:Glutamate--tRNA ligase, mitochondrial n=1 Tax=Coleophoma cylindrospora TaxID=1849047 RepID=A0A3D8SQS1_9HELO|nr:hypothetical protein BP6252_00563 [Coleophoma cylindrospora]